MRILLINPNTSVSITDRLMASASTAASRDTELVPVTAHRGVPYIASRIEAAIASQLLGTLNRLSLTTLLRPDLPLMALTMC